MSRNGAKTLTIDTQGKDTQSKGLPDRELLSKVRDDQQAFRMLYERHGDAIYRYALVVSRSRSIAEEATQEVFLYMIQHAHDFDVTRSPSALGWLFGVVRNKVRFILNQQRKAQMLTIDESVVLSPENQLEISSELKAIDRAIAQLSFEHREVLVLCALQGFDYAATATILDLPIGTVRSRLSRAREQLKYTVIEPVALRE